MKDRQSVGVQQQWQRFSEVVECHKAYVAIQLTGYERLNTVFGGARAFAELQPGTLYSVGSKRGVSG
jgi:hypothetical protein